MLASVALVVLASTRPVEEPVVPPARRTRRYRRRRRRRDGADCLARIATEAGAAAARRGQTPPSAKPRRRRSARDDLRRSARGGVPVGRLAIDTCHRRPPSRTGRAEAPPSASRSRRRGTPPRGSARARAVVRRHRRATRRRAALLSESPALLRVDAAGPRRAEGTRLPGAVWPSDCGSPCEISPSRESWVSRCALAASAALRSHCVHLVHLDDGALRLGQPRRRQRRELARVQLQASRVRERVERRAEAWAARGPPPRWPRARRARADPSFFLCGAERGERDVAPADRRRRPRAPRDTPTTADAPRASRTATSAERDDANWARLRARERPDAAESAAAARVRPAPSRGVLSTADVPSADAGATATGAADSALLAQPERVDRVCQPTTPSLAEHRRLSRPARADRMDAPRRFAGCCSAGVERKWTTKNEWFQSPFKNAFRNPFGEKLIG